MGVCRCTRGINNCALSTCFSTPLLRMVAKPHSLGPTWLISTSISEGNRATCCLPGAAQHLDLLEMSPRAATRREVSWSSPPSSHRGCPPPAPVQVLSVGKPVHRPPPTQTYRCSARLWTHRRDFTSAQCPHPRTEMRQQVCGGEDMVVLGVSRAQKTLAQLAN